MLDNGIPLKLKILIAKHQIASATQYNPEYLV